MKNLTWNTLTMNYLIMKQRALKKTVMKKPSKINASPDAISRLSQKLASTLLCAWALVGCGGSGSQGDTTTNTTRTFDVTITNGTVGQPLSPAALILHTEEWSSFQIGSPASLNLEILAESGNTQPFSEHIREKHHAFTFVNGDTNIAPGEQETLRITTRQTQSSHLSFLSMLVNTNDAFAALNATSLDALTVGEQMVLRANTYDAGTEANTESAETIPGPAALNGEGFNRGRDDVVSTIHRHAGVVTQADGLSSSILNENHRWGEPAVTVSITRVN